MKVLWVVAGALIDAQKRVLLAERPQGKNLAGFWEFPGGKIESGETPEQALCRELNEELNLSVSPDALKPLSFASFDYPDFHLVMPLFSCFDWQGTPVGKEGQRFAFVPAEQVGIDTKRFPLPPADFDLARILRKFV